MEIGWERESEGGQEQQTSKRLEVLLAQKAMGDRLPANLTRLVKCIMHDP